MSHFAVAVFANDPRDFDKLLEPYDENNYLVPHPHDEDEVRAQYEKFLEQNPGWKEQGFSYYLREFGYKRENGQIVSYYNPNAKWDWYTLSGKDYMFELKTEALERMSEDDGEWCFRKNDYDYCSYYDSPYATSEEEAASRFWELYVEGQPLRKDEKPPQTIFTREYYLGRYGTKDAYVKYTTRIFPSAFITPDGVWHEAGTMGYFAVDNATPESLERYYQEWEDYINSEENPYVNFVDCHI